MFRLALTAFLGGTMFCAQAKAVTVVIWPVDPVIAANRSATALWLENKGDTEVVLQVRCLDWDQATGTDALTSQDAVVVSPPLARVAPGKRQLVRLVRRTPPAATDKGAGEHALRILVDELPAPDPRREEGALNARLAVRMRYSIPLFTYDAAAKGQAPRLTYRMVTEAGQRFVEIANTGTMHARMTDLSIGPADRRVSLHAGLAGYVLAGATMRWPVPVGVPTASLVAGVNGAVEPIPAAA